MAVKIHIRKLTKFEAILFWFSNLLTTFDGLQSVLIFLFVPMSVKGKKKRKLLLLLLLLFLITWSNIKCNCKLDP